MSAMVETVPVTLRTRSRACEQKNQGSHWSPADVKMEIPVIILSLKSSIMRSTSFQMDKTFWGVGSAAVEQSRSKAIMAAQGDGKFGPEADPSIPPNQKRWSLLL